VEEVVKHYLALLTVAKIYRQTKRYTGGSRTLSIAAFIWRETTMITCETSDRTGRMAYANTSQGSAVTSLTIYSLTARSRLKGGDLRNRH